MRSPTLPNFLGEAAAAIWRRFVDDPPAFVMCATPVLYSSLNIFGQRFSAGVELAGAYALVSVRHRKAKTGVAAFAKPSQVVGRTVGFVPVNVIDHKKAP